jgi:hypothetical protein
MPHCGSELVVHTGLLAPIFDVGFYLMLFRVFVNQSIVSGLVFVHCNVNSRISHPPQVRDQTRPDQLAVKAGGLSPWHRLAFHVIVRHPYTSHKPLSPAKPSPFALTYHTITLSHTHALHTTDNRPIRGTYSTRCGSLTGVC